MSISYLRRSLPLFPTIYSFSLNTYWSIQNSFSWRQAFKLFLFFKWTLHCPNNTYANSSCLACCYRNCFWTQLLPSPSLPSLELHRPLYTGFYTCFSIKTKHFVLRCLCNTLLHLGLAHISPSQPCLFSDFVRTLNSTTYSIPIFCFIFSIACVISWHTKHTKLFS